MGQKSANEINADVLYAQVGSDYELLRCRAYDRAAVKFRGLAAAINFPENDYSRDWFLMVRSPCCMYIMECHFM